MDPSLRVLDNGLCVVVEESTWVDSVVVSLSVQVGSRYEISGKEGLAHFLEHMAFKGTKSRSAKDIALEFDRIGGNFNAQTGRELTTYYAKVLSQDFALAMDIISDIVFNSVFPEDEMEREKGVVIQEIGQVNDDPADLVQDIFFEKSVRERSFAHSILGDKNSVNGLSVGDLVDYVSKYYSTDNMLLVIVGNISTENAFGEAERMFGVHSKGSSKEHSFIGQNRKFRPEKASIVGGFASEQRELDQANVILGFPAVSASDPKYYDFQMLSSLLGHGMSSRLFQEVRERLGLAYSIYSFYAAYVDVGMIAIYSATDSENLSLLLKTVISEMKKLFHELDESELDLCFNKVKAELLMSGESLFSKAAILTSSYFVHGRYVSTHELVEKLGAVGVDAVKFLINSLFDDRSLLTIVGVGDVASMPSRQFLIENMVI